MSQQNRNTVFYFARKSAGKTLQNKALEQVSNFNLSNPPPLFFLIVRMVTCRCLHNSLAPGCCTVAGFSLSTESFLPEKAHSKLLPMCRFDSDHAHFRHQAQIRTLLPTGPITSFVWSYPVPISPHKYTVVKAGPQTLSVSSFGKKRLNLTWTVKKTFSQDAWPHRFYPMVWKPGRTK